MSGNPDYIFYLEIINYRIHLPYPFLQLLGDRIILSKAINGYTLYPYDVYYRLIDKAETLPVPEISSILRDCIELNVEKYGWIRLPESVNDKIGPFITAELCDEQVIIRKTEELPFNRHKMYKGYLDPCIDSEQMRNYLKKTKISSSAIVDLVMYSLIPIGQKREELIKLLNDARERNDDELVCDCNTRIEYIDTAMNYLEGDGVFSLENNYYEEADYDNYSYFVGNFARYQDAQEYIAIENNNEDLQYYNLTRWVKNSKGKLEDVCSYIIHGHDILFLDLHNGDFREDYGHFRAENLNLPVPFRAGDILECDGFPFGPKFRMLILTINDNCDCCCVQGLYLDEYGKWNCGAVKHGAVSYDYSPKPSFLYRSKIYTGELSEEEKVLQLVSEYLHGDEEKGRDLYDRIIFGSLTSNELRYIIEKV